MSSLFQAIEVETVNRCTRQCTFCKYGLSRYSKRPDSLQWMEWSLIERIISQLRGLSFVGRVSWFRINEPLLDPRISEIYKRSTSALPDAYHTLLTNGDLLTESSANSFLDMGVRIGVSCYERHSIERVRSWRCANRIRILDLQVPKEFVENRGGNVTDPSLSGVPDLERIHRMSCGRPFSSLYLLTSGDASLCCGDLFGDVIMGNISTDSLVGVWNNEAYEHLRHHLTSIGRKGLHLCEGCDYTGEVVPVRYP